MNISYYSLPHTVSSVPRGCSAWKNSVLKSLTWGNVRVLSSIYMQIHCTCMYACTCVCVYKSLHWRVWVPSRQMSIKACAVTFGISFLVISMDRPWMYSLQIVSSCWAYTWTCKQETIERNDGRSKYNHIRTTVCTSEISSLWPQQVQTCCQLPVE